MDIGNPEQTEYPFRMRVYFKLSLFYVMFSTLKFRPTKRN
jgi:hypothetical protein